MSLFIYGTWALRVGVIPVRGETTLLQLLSKMVLSENDPFKTSPDSDGVQTTVTNSLHLR